MMSPSLRNLISEQILKSDLRRRNRIWQDRDFAVYLCFVRFDVIRECLVLTRGGQMVMAFLKFDDCMSPVVLADADLSGFGYLTERLFLRFWPEVTYLGCFGDGCNEEDAKRISERVGLSYTYLCEK